jgi:glycosyltransferase involved in cell wall biosynthesis
LLELTERLRPDVVHLNSYTHAALDWRVPVVCVAHSCVLSWWDAVHGQPAPRQWRTYRSRVADGLAAADVVVAPSNAMLRELRRHYSFTGGVVVHNGRATDWVRPAVKEPIIMAAGRCWDPGKNIAAVERVAPALPYPTVIAGSPVIDGEAVQERDHGHLTWLGRLPFDELRTWLERSAIFAAPARYEPFGLGALEAALSGCALVVGDIDSLHEVWGEAAAYVDPEDDDALLRTLASLCADDETRIRAGRRARERARIYGLEPMVAGYRRIYSCVLAGRYGTAEAAS